MAYLFHNLNLLLVDLGLALDLYRGEVIAL